VKIWIVFLWLIVTPWLSSAQNALCFDGSNDGVYCGISSLHFVGNTSFSLEAWINPSSFTSQVYEGSIIVQENNSNNGGYMFRAGNGGKLNFAMGEGQGQDWAELTTSNVLSLDTWQHVAATYDGQKMRIYLNGSLVDSLAETFSVAGHGSTPLSIGYHPGYTTRHWDGAIDEVRLWNRVLSQSDIQSNMNNEICDTLLDLKAYYKFDSGTPYNSNSSITTIVDYSYNQINGTLNNFGMIDSCSNIIIGPDLEQDTTTLIYSNTSCYQYVEPNLQQTFYADTILDYYQVSTHGCVDHITRTVTINQSSLSNIEEMACDSFVSPSGNVYYTSGTYYDLIPNHKNCDSFITISLTIANSPLTEFNYSGCDSLYLLSLQQWVFNSGTYIDTATNQLGCDSIIHHNVNLKYGSFADTTLGMCRFVFNPTGNEVWQEAGIYYDTIINHLGCDSVITYHVVSYKTYDTITVNSCGPYTSPSMNKIWDKSGTYNDTMQLSNQFSCDSIIQINLNVFPIEFTEDSITACLWTRLGSGKYIDQSGVYLDTIMSANLCDSVVEYRVTIKSVNVEVKKEDFTLTALSSNASSFQWLDCDNEFNLIGGATYDTFQHNNHGKYAVEVTEDFCVDTSDCYEIYGLGMSTPKFEIKIYPNPSEGPVLVSTPYPGLNNWSYFVYNAVGELYSQGKLESVIQLPQESGLYIIELKADQKTVYRNRIIRR
jgi:hypothetical protein